MSLDGGQSLAKNGDEGIKFFLAGENPCIFLDIGRFIQRGESFIIKSNLKCGLVALIDNFDAEICIESWLL